MMTTQSRWATGTYQLMIQPDEEPGDLLITIFAMPIDDGNEEAFEDSPVLSQIEVTAVEYSGPLRSWQLGLHDVGEEAVLVPEAMESIYGPGLALRILEALLIAGRQDYLGLDAEDRPWRTPSPEAGPLMQRAAMVLKELKGRFMS